MIESESSAQDQPPRPRLTAQWVLPLALAGLALLAAPFYMRVMESVMWMGESVRALCGF